MNLNPLKRLFSFTVVSVLLSAALFLPGCGSKKEPSGATPSNLNGQQGGKLQCQAGQFADASGQSKKSLKLQPSLYYALADKASNSTLISSQDVYTKDSQVYYARSTPSGIIVTVGTGSPIFQKTLVPTLSLKLFEKDGQVILAAGNYAGIDFYTISGSALTLLTSNHFLGAVTDLSARDGRLCAIADGGKAVVQTGPEQDGAGDCSTILYESADHKAANGITMDAVHVAAVPEGCVVVTRNQPQLQIKLISLVDLIKSWITNAPQRIDLRGLEEKMLQLGSDGSSKEIAPVVGSYDKVIISDLDAFPEGAVATYTAFKKANWDDFSAEDMTTHAFRKILLLLKLFCETRGGGFFIAGGEVKRSTELQGIPWTHTFNLGAPAGGPVTFNELPHFSLPWFSEGSIDGNRYAMKTPIAFSIFDFSNWKDANVTSLPVEQYTWVNDIANPTNPLSQPDNPKGLFTDFGLAQSKLFTNGIGSGGLQSNYDFDPNAKKEMSAAPYPVGYFPLNAKLNFKQFPLGTVRDGYFGITLAGGLKLFYKKAEPGSAPQLFSPAQNFGAISLANYSLIGLPVTYESPAGEASDRFIIGYANNTTSKMLLESLHKDGSKHAVTTSEVNLGAVNTPTMGAALGPVAVFDDVLVVAYNFTGLGPSYAARLYAFKIDEGAGTLTLLPDGGSPNPEFETVTGTALKIKALRKDSGKYSVLMEVFDPTGGQEKVARVDFEQDGSKVTSSTPQEITLSNLKDLVVGGDKAYAITALGDVIPLNVAGTALSADPALGKILDVQDHKIRLGFCGLYQNDLYCSGLFDGIFIQLFKFSLDSKTQTTFAYNRPFLLSFVGSKLLVSYDLDGGGLEAFDLTKAPPQAVPDDGKGQTSAAADTGGTPGGPAQPAALPNGAQAGGSGCSLLGVSNRAYDVGFGLCWLVLSATAIGYSRLRRNTLRR